MDMKTSIRKDACEAVLTDLDDIALIVKKLADNHAILVEFMDACRYKPVNPMAAKAITEYAQIMLEEIARVRHRLDNSKFNMTCLLNSLRGNNGGKSTKETQSKDARL